MEKKKKKKIVRPNEVDHFNKIHINLKITYIPNKQKLTKKLPPPPPKKKHKKVTVK